MRSKQYAVLALACASSFLLLSCAQVENQTGRFLESAGQALYPDGPQHADYDDRGQNYGGPAGDSFAAQRDEGSSVGQDIQNSAGRVLENAGSVVRHTEKKLFVEDEEQKRQGATAIERSAGRAFDNAGSVVRDGAARLWRPSDTSGSAGSATWGDYEEQDSNVSEEDLLP
jgi:hypothetical protein